MSLIVNRKATCPKCGDTNQTYSYYATWNWVFGDHAPQIVAITKVLDKMKDVPDEKRTAKFVCVLTLVMPNGETKVVRGETHGKIVRTPGPLGKLTYSPIFIPDGFNKTMNELTEEEIGTTHREKALNELLKLLKEEKYLD